MTALRGRRVVVTRAPGQAGPLVASLRAAGADVLELPTVSIEPPTDRTDLDAALTRIDEYDWLVLTSANGANALGPRPTGNGPRLAAVGPATAAALADRGWAEPWLPSRPSAGALAEELPVQPGERVLLLRSDLADAALPAALKARGARVDDVVAYRTVPRTDRIPLPEADAFILMSPSAVDGLINALGGDATKLAGKLLVAAGPTTADYLRSKGLCPAEAKSPTPEALLDALAAVPA